MVSLWSWLQLCSILTAVGEINTYVLFAANVDDFRNIARKIVPETLADKLARLASVPAKQKTRVDITESEYDYGSETDDVDERDDDNTRGTDNEDSNLRNVNSMYVKDWNTRVNFDELVERVKDRLAKEMREEIQKRVDKTQKSERESAYSNKNTQNIADNISVPNKKPFGYNIDRDHKTKNIDSYNSKNKYYVDEGFTEVTRNYEPITSYDDKYEVSEKIYPNKEKPEYIDYQQNKQGYNDRDEKYETEKQKGIHSPDIKVNGNSKDKEYIEKYVYENYDVNLQNNNNNEYENAPEESKHEDLYNKYHEKDDPTEIISKLKNKTIKIHKHFKETTPEANKFQNIGESLYNQFDLVSKRKNDSYEDYVVPNKEEDVFISEEQNDRVKDATNIKLNVNKNSRFQIKNNAKDNVRPFKSEWKADRYNGPDDSKESEEIKAKTESLWFEDRSKDTEVSETKGKGTMIPTRETYKMSSPNYYISLPTVAEKYDSDEPLPERDRERQIIKHFVNPPASINKKVRLLK